ncbi:polymorphic toxin type 17 domain-containing protein [Glycomyces sp. A-F 0318]|uniref:polymorphic toxin type 17 domain-containing protein n=1 Tax=Glycomyces amatae TaxID=2881355 RepID=UPI001E44649D|nr:polymorphic toxin type 17 domain-containing protein [Glycomyces amatae]MCD0445668.1 polymorphic toxin type 17 domain-containing protein [Glycomyces amatae]
MASKRRRNNPELPEGGAELIKKPVRGLFKNGKGGLKKGGDGADASAPRTGVKGLLKDAGLPTSGRIRYVPPKGVTPTTGLPKGPNGGYFDRHGNEWVKGPSRTKGEPYEWDVQLSSKGRNQIGWTTRDGSHANVSLGGHITHK